MLVEIKNHRGRDINVIKVSEKLSGVRCTKIVHCLQRYINVKWHVKGSQVEVCVFSKLHEEFENRNAFILEIRNQCGRDDNLTFKIVRI